MGNLTRRDEYDPAPLSRQARKQLDRLQEQLQLKRAAAEARLVGQLDQVKADEQVALCQAALRVVGSHQLAGIAAEEAVQFDLGVSRATAGKPGLELTARSFGETAAVVSNVVIYRYGTAR
jgi:hypothetical protein